MGIELPPELADVAAQAGVTWPEADEEAMAQTAQAWRTAATDVSRLAADADSTVRTTLDAVRGEAGDAASRHWSSFVEPDTGHLSAAVRGCSDAADRLEHAANQVGTAKVEIVRNLVALGQNSDAAHEAAAAGHPTALTGLDTAVRGTTANVANITGNLVSAVQPLSGVDMAAVQNPVNANPGVHAAVETVSSTVDSTVSTVDETVGAVAAAPGQVAGGGPGTLPVPGVPGDELLPQPDGPGAPGGPGGGLPVEPGGPGLGLGVPVEPGGPGVGVPGVPGGVEPGIPGVDPDVTGPVPIPPGRGPGDLIPGVIDDLPTPPSGQTVQAGFAGPGVDAAAPQQGGNLPPAAPPAPGAGGAPAPGAGGPTFGPTGGPAPGAPAAPPPPQAAPAAQAAPVPAQRMPARPLLGGVAEIPPADQPRAKVAPAGGPPGAPPPWKGDKDGVLAAFWIHMFPIGHLPVASYRPARQLPRPHEELDYAAGIRFGPADHPRHDLVDSTERRAALADGAGEIELGAGLAADDPAVAGLAEGHDPLGEMHERDWDRRYLARFGSVTAQGISAEGVEFSWPFSEVNPEGGTAPGEAEVLDEGTVIDRFGSPDGRVFAEDGTPFTQRSLPPTHLELGYHRYRVLRPLPVWRTVSAPWFAQAGGGIRYRTTHSVVELIALGYLEDVTEGAGE